MFKDWGFLITEMVGLLILAALIGLFVGWLIWGRRSVVAVDDGQVAQLRADLDACGKARAELEAKLVTSQADLEAYGFARNEVEAEANRLAAELAECRAAIEAGDADNADMHSALDMVLAGNAVSATDADDHIPDYDGDGVLEGRDEGTKPAALTAARGGVPDDLKQIKGIGPKLEQLCHRLGFYHFDQIAAWTADEVAWVDANLDGFKGRVSRDEWVAQAKILAAGGETDFSKRVEDGDVY